MKTRTIIVSLLVIIVIVLAVVFTRKNSTKSVENAGPIKIGAILPKTGDFATFGESINQGALLAVEELKAEGYNIEYISEDDKSSASGSVNAANKLVNADIVSGVLTATVQEVKPVKAIFDNGTIPLLAVWDSNDYIKNSGVNIFTIGFSTEDAGYQMAEYAVNKLGKKNFAVISQKDEWSELIASAFAKKVIDLGATISYQDSIQPTVKDFRSVITAAKAKKVDGVYIPFLPGAIGPFISQASQLELNAQIMTGDSFSMDEVNQTGKASEGVLFTNLHSTGADKLAAAYKEKFGSAPTDSLFVTFGYNGVKTLVSAITNAQKKNITVSDALRQTKLEGIDGAIDFKKTQQSEKLEKLYKVENGAFVEVK